MDSSGDSHDMGITRKPSAAVNRLSHDFPDSIPALPKEVLDRFPSMGDWHDEMQKMWTAFRTVMSRRDDELVQMLASKADL